MPPKKAPARGGAGAVTAGVVIVACLLLVIRMCLLSTTTSVVPPPPQPSPSSQQPPVAAVVTAELGGATPSAIMSTPATLNRELRRNSPPPTRDDASSPSPPPPQTAPIRAVILFLYGGRWHDYFVRDCLPRLDAYLLRCFPYPVHVFHEGAPAAQRAVITGAVPHAPAVDFEDVGWVWKNLPGPGVTEAKVSQWMQEGVQKKFAGRGYRVMCRFWTGVAWSLPSMDKYDYYWRLDTDSVLTKPVLVDPFRHVFVERACEYGYNRLKGENPHVATGMWEAFEAWAMGEAAELPGAAFDRVRELALNPPPGTVQPLSVVDKKGGGRKRSFWAPMYYNNFEMGSFRLKRSAAYNSFFEHIDRKEPYGIFRYRWGDAPLHTLAVVAILEDAKRCNVSQSTVGYKHAAKRLEPLLPSAKLPQCPRPRD